jgi:topoisomerase IV subunit A
VSNRRAGRDFMSLKEGDVPVVPSIFEEMLGNHAVAVSESGRMLAIDLDDIGYLPRGRGVVIMGLDKGEKMMAIAVTAKRAIMVKGTGRGGKEKELRVAGDDFAHYMGSRANKGRVLPEKIKPLSLAPTRAANGEGQ